LKIEFQEMKLVTDRASAVGLVSAPLPANAPQYSLQLVASADPNLALAGLRIELERRLTQLAESRAMQPDRAGVGRLLES
jgi:hypothetical protein